MALSPVAIPIRFAGGVDTKTDPKGVQPTRLIALENAVFTRSTTISKRTGYVALRKTVDGGDNYIEPKALGKRGDELVLFAGDKLYSYRESSATWSEVGHAQSIAHTERAIAATGTDQSMPDSASLNGITAVAWEDSRGGVWWSVVELVSGRLLRQPEQLDANGQRPRVLAVGDRIHVYFALPAANRIMVATVNPDTYLEPLALEILVDTLNASNPTYDAMVVDESLGIGAVMAWALDTGGWRIGYVTPAGAIGTSGTGWAPATSWSSDAIDGPLAVVTSPTSTPFVGVVFATVGTVRCRLLDATDLSNSIADGEVLADFEETIIRVAAVATPPDEDDLSTVWIWGEEDHGGRDNLIKTGTFTSSGADSHAEAPLRGHGLVSRGFIDNGDAYVLIAHEVPLFPYVAALRGIDGLELVCVGRLIVGSSDGLPDRGHLTSVETDADDARVHRWIGCAREMVNADAAQFTETGLRRVTLDFDADNAFQSAEFGPDLVIAGALPLRYDGDTVAELGFHSAPDGTITATPSSGGSLTAEQSYLYAICYEEVDAQGVIHPGPMSIGTLVALATGQTRVTLTIPTYRLTSKRRVRIGVFRSEANDTEAAANGFPDLYRVTSLDPSATGANGYLVNDATVDTVTFVDELSDATLLLRERAYTNNGVLSNDPVGLGSIVVGGKGRLFFSDPTDPGLVRFTQTRRDGYGPEISADLSVRFDQAGGDIGALGILDDALIVFKERAIEFIAGPGPLANPDAAPQIGFSTPQQIPSEVGCVSPRSIATTTERLFFQAAQNGGICQVDRSRNVNYIGAPVEAYNSQDIVSADPIPGSNLVVFLTDEGKTVVFDTYHGQWSTWTNHEGADAVVVAGLYHYLRSNAADGRVFRSDEATYFDADVPYRLKLETAWIRLTGYYQSLQKIWYAILLGKWISSHWLEVKIATDYRPGWGEPYLLEVDADNNPDPYGEGPYGEGPYGGHSDAVYQQRIHVGEKCQAIRFSIGEPTTPPQNGNGGAFELSELLLTGGVMRDAAQWRSSVVPFEPPTP